MQNPDFQSKMVGRESELKELQAYLDKAAGGEGRTIFISGEAGIGKTRLVEELKQIAQSKGFQILSGNSMYESLTPFMPVMDALRSGGLESLFTEEAPRVEAVYLVTHGGVLIKDVMRQETKLSPVLFTSMLTVVGNFVTETLSILSEEKKEGALNTLGYENFRILIESGKSANLVVLLTGKENEFLIKDIREIKLNVEKEYENVLKDWDGDEKSVKGIEKNLNPLITSGKYDGIYYGKEDPKIRRNLLFENVSLGLTRYAKIAPTLMCIDDLQWADPSSLALMHYISRNTRKYGLIILGTYRPEDVAAMDGKEYPLVGTMQVMDREDLYEKIELARLPEGSMDEFLFALLGKIDFTDEFKDRIYQETEGNPLFVIQLMKFLVEENVIKTDNGTWRLAKDFIDIEIPSKIYNVIKRRLNRLEKEDRKVLDYACVIGETFTSSILTDALDTNRTQLLEQLRGLEQTHSLIHSHDGNFKFDHAKVKEVLYSEIPEELRMDYHLIIANSIETLNKDNLEEVIEDLAFHFYRCKNNEKALHYLIKAAEKAKKDYSNEEAIRFYSEALEFEVDAQKKAEIYEAQGDICRLSGDFKKSIELYNNAIELGKEKLRIAEIKGKIGWSNQCIGKYDETVRICTEALDLVRGEECKEEVFVLLHIGHGLIRRGDFDRALKYLEKGLQIGQKINDQIDSAGIYTMFALIYWYQGNYYKGIDFVLKSLEIYEKIGNQRGIAVGNSNIGFGYGRLGEYERALEYYKKSSEIVETCGFQECKAYNAWGLSEVYYSKGNLMRALSNAQKAFKISTKMGLSEVIVQAYKMLGMIYGKQKKWEESIRNFENSIIICKEIGLKNELAESQFEFGLMWIAKGDVDKAKENFQKAIDIFEELKVEKKVEIVKVALNDL